MLPVDLDRAGDVAFALGALVLAMVALMVVAVGGN